MATRKIPLPAGVWTEVTALAAMADGSSYVVEPAGGAAEAIDVTGAQAPEADDEGHTWFPGTHRRPADYRSFTKNAGQTWWWRPAGPGVRLIISDI